MSIKQMWKSFTGTDHLKKAVQTATGREVNATKTDAEKKAAGGTSAGAPSGTGSF
jgi:hypothetical protein